MAVEMTKRALIKGGAIAPALNFEKFYTVHCNQIMILKGQDSM